jgi:PAS domain-containing protein
MFENSMEAAYETSPEGRILTANPALRGRLADLMQLEGSIRNAEYQLRRSDGGLITVQENARVVRGEQGEALCYEGTLKEISNGGVGSEAVGLKRENVAVDKTPVLH